MLETCGVLQCERLYQEIIKEAQEKLGAEQPVTTKVNRDVITFPLLASKREQSVTQSC